jgi:chemotaxis protein CheX
MSVSVALIDFPRLQEQIASRLLAEYSAEVHCVNHREAAARLDTYDLALYFWPDSATDAAERLRQLRPQDSAAGVPLVIVTSESGKGIVERALPAGTVADILVTPLQPHLVSRKLAALLGMRKDPPAGQLDVQYINPFLEATAETFRQMAGMECVRTGVTVRVDGSTKGFISGTMGLSGPAEGFVALTFEDSLARKIVCRMLQVQPGEETEDDIRDAVGELMNMIAGRAKAELVNTEHSFQLSLPTTIVGGPHTVGKVRGVPVVVISFAIAESDRFEIMVCLIPRRK